MNMHPWNVKQVSTYQRCSPRQTYTVIVHQRCGSSVTGQFTIPQDAMTFGLVVSSGTGIIITVQIGRFYQQRTLRPPIWSAPKLWTQLFSSSAPSNTVTNWDPAVRVPRYGLGGCRWSRATSRLFKIHLWLKGLLFARFCNKSIY